ncbi:MAG TPA: class I SAM-dependent methyltransferase, partial [Terriglobales bacterium]|nr:class I SAM-dependent methyltransferase [Terriglobales bacterium]
LFAQDVLDWSERKFPAFFAALHYRLEERSPALQEKLQKTLSRHFASGKASLASGDGFKDPVIVFANEFFDAFPVEIVSREGSLRVSASNGRLTESWVSTNADESAFLDRYSVQPDGRERLEVPLAAQRYMSKLASSMSRGFMVVIDYGYTRAEQGAGRHRGTLMTYRQHSAGVNPYEAPGEQDITSHVNFTALGAAAEQGGMRVEKLVTQSQFLMGIGEANQFADAFEGARLPQERAKVALQLKHLVTPAGMGESFHVLVGSKGAERGLELSGLGFGRI